MNIKHEFDRALSGQRALLRKDQETIRAALGQSINAIVARRIRSDVRFPVLVACLLNICELADKITEEDSQHRQDDKKLRKLQNAYNQLAASSQSKELGRLQALMVTKNAKIDELRTTVKYLRNCNGVLKKKLRIAIEIEPQLRTKND
jgi:hypothetical protein